MCQGSVCKSQLLSVWRMLASGPRVVVLVTAVQWCGDAESQVATAIWRWHLGRGGGDGDDGGGEGLPCWRRLCESILLSVWRVLVFASLMVVVVDFLFSMILKDVVSSVVCVSGPSCWWWWRWQKLRVVHHW